MLQQQDRNVVSGQISNIDVGLSQLEAVESRLSAELSDIRAKIENLRNQRAALESRIAVVWSLPNEILSYIFEIGVTQEREGAATNADDEEPYAGYFGFHILVSHVCRMFREVSVHTPNLWSRIHIFDLATPRLDFVRTSIERSGKSGLDIMVSCDEEHFEPNSEPIHLLMGLLAPHTSHFQRLTVRLRGFQALSQVMRRLDQPAPQLEVLELSDIDYEHAFDQDGPFDPPALREPLILFNGAMPKLKGVSLDGAHVSWAKCNFTSLVDFHLGYHTLDVRPSYEEFKAIIDASPALQTLDFRGSAPLISDDNTESSLYPPIHMERLEELRISDIPSDYATTLIPLLSAPHLQSLSLTDLDTNDYSAFFRKIIGPPSLFPALTALKLASIEVDDDSIEDLLRAYSKVTHLGLYFNRMPTTWLNYLEPRGSENEVLCPKLECLRCVCASTSDIKKVLEKRREAGFPIPKVQIDKETEDWGTKVCVKWLKENAELEIIEPSEHGSDDEEVDDTGSEWATDQDDEIGGFPYFSMEGFSDDEDDEDEDEDHDYEDASEMEVDGIFGSESEDEEE